jgi:hypothetical protein
MLSDLPRASPISYRTLLGKGLSDAVGRMSRTSDSPRPISLRDANVLRPIIRHRILARQGPDNSRPDTSRSVR